MKVSLFLFVFNFYTILLLAQTEDWVVDKSSKKFEFYTNSAVASEGIVFLRRSCQVSEIQSNVSCFDRFGNRLRIAASHFYQFVEEKGSKQVLGTFELSDRLYVIVGAYNRNSLSYEGVRVIWMNGADLEEVANLGRFEMDKNSSIHITKSSNDKAVMFVPERMVKESQYSVISSDFLLNYKYYGGIKVFDSSFMKLDEVELDDYVYTDLIIKDNGDVAGILLEKESILNGGSEKREFNGPFAQPVFLVEVNLLANRVKDVEYFVRTGFETKMKKLDFFGETCMNPVILWKGSRLEVIALSYERSDGAVGLFYTIDSTSLEYVEHIVEISTYYEGAKNKHYLHRPHVLADGTYVLLTEEFHRGYMKITRSKDEDEIGVLDRSTNTLHVQKTYTSGDCNLFTISKDYELLMEEYIERDFRSLSEGGLAGVELLSNEQSAFLICPFVNSTTFTNKGYVECYRVSANSIESSMLIPETKKAFFSIPRCFEIFDDKILLVGKRFKSNKSLFRFQEL